MSQRPKRDRQPPTTGPTLVAYRATSNSKPASDTGTAPASAATTAPAAKRQRTAPPADSNTRKTAAPKPKKTKNKEKNKSTTPSTQSKPQKKKIQKQKPAARLTTPSPPSQADLGFFSPNSNHNSDGALNQDTPIKPIEISSGDDAEDESPPSRASNRTRRSASPLLDDFAASQDNDLDGSDTDNTSELQLEIPTLAGDVRVRVSKTISYSKLLRTVHMSVGCSDVKIKPTLSAQTGANPKAKDSKLALHSTTTWAVIVEDALDKYQLATMGKGQKAIAERASLPKIKICIEEEYMKNLKHTRDKAKATGDGNGLKKKKLAPVDLNASDNDESTPSTYDLGARQRKASTEVNAEYKVCKTGRCSGPCVRISDTLCNPVSQAMLSTLIDAIANGAAGVTVLNPPKQDMFNIWPGRSQAFGGRDRSPRRARRLSDRFSPYQPSHHRSHRQSYRERSPRHHRSPPPSSTASAPRFPAAMIAINSTSFSHLPDPAIPEFLTALHDTAAYTRRNLARLIPHFEDRDFYSISSIAHFDDVQLVQRVPEVSAGNAVFILSAITQYLRSVPT